MLLVGLLADYFYLFALPHYFLLKCEVSDYQVVPSMIHYGDCGCIEENVGLLRFHWSV